MKLVPKVKERTPRSLTFAESVKVLEAKYPPKHGPRGPKRQPRPIVATVLDRLPNQGGETNWRKQDSIPVGEPTAGIWAEPNHRGMAVQRQKDMKRK